MTSVNFDITYEWYTQYDGAFVLSGFYKDVSDFVVKETSGEAIPLPGFEGLYNVTTFINLSDGNANGYEIGLFQPLGKIFPALAGFGFSANYTFVDSEFDKDVGDGGFGFPGSSEDNFNFIGFYEADSYAIRVAYTYRSEFFRSLEGTGSQGSSARFTGSQENLNVSVNVKPMKGVSVRFAANNLTNEKRRDFIGVESTFQDYFDRGRTYSITANYSF
jgi:TonB-dependent receptor